MNSFPCMSGFDVLSAMSSRATDEHSFSKCVQLHRMSSRFSEYIFQMMRSATWDSKVVAGMQATHHMRAYDTLLGFEAKGEVLEPMMSKRGIYCTII